MTAVWGLYLGALAASALTWAALWWTLRQQRHWLNRITESLEPAVDLEQESGVDKVAAACDRFQVSIDARTAALVSRIDEITALIEGRLTEGGLDDPDARKARHLHVVEEP